MNFLGIEELDIYFLFLSPKNKKCDFKKPLTLINKYQELIYTLKKVKAIINTAEIINN